MSRNFVSRCREEIIKTMPNEKKKPEGSVRTRFKPVVAVGDEYGWFGIDQKNKQNPRASYQRSHNQSLFEKVSTFKRKLGVQKSKTSPFMQNVDKTRWSPTLRQRQLESGEPDCQKPSEVSGN